MVAWAGAADALMDDALDVAGVLVVADVVGVALMPLAPVVALVDGAEVPAADVLAAVDDAAVLTACCPMKPTRPRVPTLARMPVASVALEIRRRAAFRAAPAAPRRGGATWGDAVELVRGSFVMIQACLMWVSRFRDLHKDGRRISTILRGTSNPWRVVQLAERRTLDPEVGGSSPPSPARALRR